MKEEEVKNKLKSTFFNSKAFDATRQIGNIDFCISYQAGNLFESIHFLWAEAKRSSKADILESFVQLILTIGKEKTFENELPPTFLGAFDDEKIAFVPYDEIMHIFNQNDFNWNVTPSKHDTKEFKQLYETSKKLLESKKLQFDYKTNSKELQEFIKANFTLANKHTHKIQITKNNFTIIYQKWLTKVKDSISIDWELAKKSGILDADFYLADLLSIDNKTIKDKLFVILENDHYTFDTKKTDIGSVISEKSAFNDNQKAHNAFWNLYERPPKEEFWDYIIERRDLLVPQDIRERKGAFFTPQMWVQKAQSYLTKALGENYQEEYYIWDCAAGTGNLLVGLANPARIYASTLDKADVEIMKDLAKNKSLNVFEGNIFQFDFLNDDLLDKPCNKHKDFDSTCKDCCPSELPKTLQNIIKDEAKRKKLVIFINPPYAEATSATTITNTGSNKALVARGNQVSEKYKNPLGEANNELFAQFFIRIYKEIPDCIMASFSKLKYINSQNFIKFRETFKAKFLQGFIAPAYTFDNVKGKFPIGFLVWDLNQKVSFRKIKLDIFDEKAKYQGKKNFYSDDAKESLNKWIVKFKDNAQNLAYIVNIPPDFQHNSQVALLSQPQKRYCLNVTQNNLIYFCIYFAVRHVIPATWINDRDQFLYPNDEWQKDAKFQNDCLAFTLFHGQNRITRSEGINHFIPFSEVKVGAKESFESHFMNDFIEGKLSKNLTHSKSQKAKEQGFSDESFYIKSLIPTKPLNFSQEALAVFEAGKALWKHYHSREFNDNKKPYNANASLYDIKEFFQGRNEKGKMNSPQKADDEYYKTLIADLNAALNNLAKKLEIKIYEYGFLKE